jgi:hypothetical protein
MAKRSAAQLAKAKEAKQKKLLLVLLPFFLLLVAWQGPKMYKQLFAQPAPEGATATETTTAPAATTPGAPPAPGAPASPAGQLADSDPVPAADGDQLGSLSRFAARDPFQAPSGAATGDAPETTTLTSATIEVNGTSETVTVNGTFPAADPIFQLVSVSSSQIVLSLTSGEFESGEANVQLAVGEQVELVGDDGSTYAVTVVSVS